MLLSTPAHAAGEIDRLIKSVKEDRMPMDENRISYALTPENKQWLLGERGGLPVHRSRPASGKPRPRAVRSRWQGSPSRRARTRR